MSAANKSSVSEHKESSSGSLIFHFKRPENGSSTADFGKIAGNQLNSPFAFPNFKSGSATGKILKLNGSEVELNMV